MASGTPGFPWDTFRKSTYEGATGPVDALRGLAIPGNSAEAFQQMRALGGALLAPRRTLDSVTQLVRVTADEGRLGAIDPRRSLARIGGDMAGAGGTTFGVTTAITMALGPVYLATPPGAWSLAHSSRVVARVAPAAMPVSLQVHAAKFLAKTPLGFAVGGAVTTALWVGGATERRATASVNQVRHPAQASAVSASGLEAVFAPMIALIDRTPP